MVCFQTFFWFSQYFGFGTTIGLHRNCQKLKIQFFSRKYHKNHQKFELIPSKYCNVASFGMFWNYSGKFCVQNSLSKIFFAYICGAPLQFPKNLQNFCFKETIEKITKLNIKHTPLNLANLLLLVCFGLISVYFLDRNAFLRLWKFFHWTYN